MTSPSSQALADRLAELAGWKNRPVDLYLMGATPWYRPASNPRDPGDSQYTHPFPVGSLDALERWRGEWLKGWEWWNVAWAQQEVEAGLIMKHGFTLKRTGPDEWTARAAALIAVKESKK